MATIKKKEMEIIDALRKQTKQRRDQAEEQSKQADVAQKQAELQLKQAEEQWQLADVARKQAEEQSKQAELQLKMAVAERTQAEEQWMQVERRWNREVWELFSSFMAKRTSLVEVFKFMCENCTTDMPKPNDRLTSFIKGQTRDVYLSRASRQSRFQWDA